MHKMRLQNQLLRFESATDLKYNAYSAVIHDIITEYFL